MLEFLLLCWQRLQPSPRLGLLSQVPITSLVFESSLLCHSRALCRCLSILVQVYLLESGASVVKNFSLGLDFGMSLIAWHSVALGLGRFISSWGHYMIQTGG